MNRSGSAGDFEGWLERELGRVLGAERAPRPRAAQAAYRARAGVRRGIGKLGAAALMATLAVAAGAGGAALATGSPNPVTWGEQVVRAVSTCADQAGGGCAGASARQRPQTPADTPPEHRGGAGQPAAGSQQADQGVAAGSPGHGPAAKASPVGSGQPVDHTNKAQDHGQGQTRGASVTPSPK